MRILSRTGSRFKHGTHGLKVEQCIFIKKCMSENTVNEKLTISGVDM